MHPSSRHDHPPPFPLMLQARYWGCEPFPGHYRGGGRGVICLYPPSSRLSFHAFGSHECLSVMFHDSCSHGYATSATPLDQSAFLAGGGAGAGDVTSATRRVVCSGNRWRDLCHGVDGLALRCNIKTVMSWAKVTGALGRVVCSGSRRHDLGRGLLSFLLHCPPLGLLGGRWRWVRLCWGSYVCPCKRKKKGGENKGGCPHVVPIVFFIFSLFACGSHIYC